LLRGAKSRGGGGRRGCDGRAWGRPGCDGEREYWRGCARRGSACFSDVKVFLVLHSFLHSRPLRVRERAAGNATRTRSVAPLCAHERSGTPTSLSPRHAPPPVALARGGHRRGRAGTTPHPLPSSPPALHRPSPGPPAPGSGPAGGGGRAGGLGADQLSFRAMSVRGVRRRKQRAQDLAARFLFSAAPRSPPRRPVCQGVPARPWATTITPPTDR